MKKSLREEIHLRWKKSLRDEVLVYDEGVYLKRYDSHPSKDRGTGRAERAMKSEQARKKSLREEIRCKRMKSSSMTRVKA